MEFSFDGLNFPGNPDHPVPNIARMTEGLFHALRLFYLAMLSLTQII